jgi:hypothetical protein
VEAQRIFRRGRSDGMTARRLEGSGESKKRPTPRLCNRLSDSALCRPSLGTIANQPAESEKAELKL